MKIALVAHEQILVPDWVVQTLHDEGAEFVAHECTSQDDLRELAADADLIWVRSGSRIIQPESLDFLTRCGAILRTGTGTDNLPVADQPAEGADLRGIHPQGWHAD